MAGELILVVDDTPMSLKLAHVLLHAQGYHVQTAGSAADALIFLKQSIPDLILMDIQMPEMNGLELTRLLRSDAAMRGVRIVALSACDSDDDEKAALTAGCQGYIRKPLAPATFAAIVRSHIDRPIVLP